MWTPFPYMVYFPAAILVGKAINIGQGIGVMTGWLIVSSILNRWLWRKGIKQYSGMGA
jgi:ABC-2 type transport system permease protein